ncbi:MAG TPA: hypothetical protein DGR79_05685 [Clostridiales bacterium]|nr:hypothetical protein [Clostridiales bacterium]
MPWRKVWWNRWRKTCATTGGVRELASRRVLSELVRISAAPEQAPLHPRIPEKFLDLCHEFNSRSSVCGLGKDNLVAGGIR